MKNLSQNHHRLFLSSFIFTLMALMSTGLAAAHLELRPGLWETSMTRTNPMTGQPITEVKTECITENRFDPADMMKDVEECKTVQNEVSNNTLTFKMVCSMHGTESTVSGTMSTDGQTGKGNMDLSINAQGMQMTMSMKWTSKRLGDCPE
jgi:hypothetical protein